MLVDNGSIDGSERLLSDLEGSNQPEWLAGPLPYPPRVIRNSENLGFAQGNNVALREARTPYVALLNNDAIADAGWLSELVSAICDSPRCVGMVASTMVFSQRPDVVASAGIRIHRDGVALDRAMGMAVADIEGWGVRPVFGPSAGAALYRRKLLGDAGLFDPRFFSYLEDADLAWRARSRGWRAVHAPRARVLHEYSATGGHNSPFKTSLISRNRVWLVYKNMPEVLLSRYWRYILRYDLMAVAGGLLSCNRHILRGRLKALSLLPSLRSDRWKNITSARLHPDEIDALLSPPLSPRGHLRYRRRLDALVSS